jgi:RNA exonuclease 4
MVGVGPNGSESSLARVSIVNFFGHTVMDVYVRQREKVTDWRTFVSGIRPADMINAKPFKEVQQEIADLIKDRVLIGHAIENDLRALLLSQPKHLVRDTQRLAGHSKLLGGSKRPSLRKLIEKEFGVVIQQGEHNSVRSIMGRSISTYH